MPRTTTSAPARRLVGALAALAVALAGMTATAMPARAQGDDLLRLFLGAATIAIIGGAIAGATQPPPPAYPTYPPYPPRPVGPPVPPPPYHPPRPVPPPAAWIPAHCEIRVGGRSYFGDVCLARAGFGGRLPPACARQVQTPRGWRTAYDGACLRHYGWRN